MGQTQNARPLVDDDMNKSCMNGFEIRVKHQMRHWQEMRSEGNQDKVTAALEWIVTERPVDRPDDISILG